MLSTRQQFYLASASPRRRALLQQLGLAPRLLPCDIDEEVRPGESAVDYVSRLARAKAEAAWQRLGNKDSAAVLGADTAVTVDGEILGKPLNMEDARRMLSLLSARVHHVLTAVAVCAPDGMHDALCVTEVEFREVSAAEIDAYLRSGEPTDKAGAYAVQGKGAVFVKHINGSYSNVVGLPLFETAQILATCGIDPWT